MLSYLCTGLNFLNNFSEPYLYAYSFAYFIHIYQHIVILWYVVAAPEMINTYAIYRSTDIQNALEATSTLHAYCVIIYSIRSAKLSHHGL